MLAETGFKFCPQCGNNGLQEHDRKAAYCPSCGFVYYHNAAAAAAAIIETEAGILLERRRLDPRAGRLDLPGGFVDYNESAEEAVRREVREELGLSLGDLRYLGSYPNHYQYRGVGYHTTDSVFISSAVDRSGDVDASEVSELVILRPGELDLDDIAFISMRRALEDYLKLSAQ